MVKLKNNILSQGQFLFKLLTKKLLRIWKFSFSWGGLGFTNIDQIRMYKISCILCLVSEKYSYITLLIFLYHYDYMTTISDHFRLFSNCLSMGPFFSWNHCAPTRYSIYCPPEWLYKSLDYELCAGLGSLTFVCLYSLVVIYFCLIYLFCYILCCL